MVAATERKDNNEMTNGAAVAAYLGAMIGLIALGMSALLAELSEEAKVVIHSIGKLWMPGAVGIGPYSGKETLGLVAWLGSWVGLHFWLRRKELNGAFWLVVFLIGIGLATTLIWPPVWHLFVSH